MRPIHHLAMPWEGDTMANAVRKGISVAVRLQGLKSRNQLFIFEVFMVRIIPNRNARAGSQFVSLRPLRRLFAVAAKKTAHDQRFFGIMRRWRNKYFHEG